MFEIPGTSRITRRDSREDIGHTSALETKRSGTELSATLLKENGFDSPQMVGRFKETSHPVFNSISALSRGLLKKIE